MKIVVFNGTPNKGVTYHMKEMFLGNLGQNEITEYYPDDLPAFCYSCKNCFLKGVEKCPHFNKMESIWNSMTSADLIVFAYPVFALRAPASIKSLLDHLCVHWIVHRPEKEMFTKTAVIITNSSGAPNRTAQKDVKTSLSWMGVSKIYVAGASLMGDVIWKDMTDKNRKMLERKMNKLAGKIIALKPVKRMSIKVKLLFALGIIEHKMIVKSESTPSLDTMHYIQNGWIKGPK